MSDLMPPVSAGRSARVSVEVISARGLRNERKLPFARMSPCALVSLPALPSCWKALPPAVNGGRNPTWGGGPQFTAEFAVNDLLPRLESSPQHPSASAFPSDSSFPASPVSSASADYKSTASTFPSPASSAAASFPPAALPPHACVQVRVELFSSAALRKSLGAATVALDAVLRRPGEWQRAELPVMRARRKRGHERAKQSGWVTVRVRVGGVVEGGRTEDAAPCWQPPLAPIPSFYAHTLTEDSACVDGADVDGADVHGARREGEAAAAGAVAAGAAGAPIRAQEHSKVTQLPSSRSHQTTAPSPPLPTPPPPPPVTGYPAPPPYSHTTAPYYPPPQYPLPNQGPYAQPTSSSHPYTAYAGPTNPSGPWYSSLQAPPVTAYKHSKHGQKRRGAGRAGLGAGLALGALGGLLVGDAIGDGLGDAGGFDFGGFGDFGF